MLKSCENTSYTNEGELQYTDSLDACVDFFSKAGSIFDKKVQSFYDNPESVTGLFVKAWNTDKEIAFKLLFWLRDCRGGAGNRSGFRKCVKLVANSNPAWVTKNIELISKHGRYDDLRSLFNTPCEDVAVSYWTWKIFQKDVLAAKWAKRTDVPLYLKLKKENVVKNMGDFRRLLSSIRSEHIVETKMCNREWHKIDYSHVPSVAMTRYGKIFAKNGGDLYRNYLVDVASGKKEIKTSVLFPHNCLTSLRSDNEELAKLQFENLPNYIGDEKSIMVIADTSGSMESPVTPTVTALDISVSLALYCSSFLPKSSPFYKKFIQFCDESSFTDWSDHSFGYDVLKLFNRAVGSTRIDLALKLILSTAKMFNVKDEDMPKMLLIISDMQFSQGVEHDDETETIVKLTLNKFRESGYTIPKVVYWNVMPYAGSPDLSVTKNVGMVSGFSPSILSSVLSCDDFSSVSIMMKAIDKYEIVIP